MRIERTVQIMKARIITSESVIRQKIQEEHQKYKDEVYRQVLDDVIPQVLAVALVTLNKNFGFGEKRLRNVISGMAAYFALMDGVKILDRKLTPLDCMEYLKIKYGIDLDEEVKKM